MLQKNILGLGRQGKARHNQLEIFCNEHITLNEHSAINLTILSIKAGTST